MILAWCLLPGAKQPLGYAIPVTRSLPLISTLHELDPKKTLTQEALAEVRDTVDNYFAIPSKLFERRGSHEEFWRNYILQLTDSCFHQVEFAYL